MLTKAVLINFKGEQVHEIDMPHEASVVRWDDRYWKRIDEQSSPVVFREAGFFWAESHPFKPYWLFLVGAPMDESVNKKGMNAFAGQFPTFDDAEKVGEDSGQSYQIVDERNSQRHYFRSRVDGSHGWSDGRE